MDLNKRQTLQLLEAEPSDALEILEMHTAAFNYPYEPVFFLFFPQEEDRENGVKRMVDWWLEDPAATYVKVVDTETGKIVSAAKWCIRKEAPTEAQLNEKLQFTWLVDAGVRDWGEQIHKFLVQEQLSRAKNGGCCSMFTQNDDINGLFGKALTDPFKVIDMLSTHPDHERRGAGSMLLKWGTDIADTLGLKAFVQGSRVGKRFYERHGFVDTEGWITVPVSEKFKDRPAVGWYNLERPAKPLMVLEATETV